MKKPKYWSQPATRTHVAAEDRARAWSGKTASRKVRNEGRYLAAQEHDTRSKRAYQAAAAKNWHPR